MTRAPLTIYIDVQDRMGRTDLREFRFLPTPSGGYDVLVEIDGQGRLEGHGGDLYWALADLRRQLDSLPIKVLCNGARRNVRPSAMGSQMSDGRKAYAYTLGMRSSLADLCDIFSAAPAEDVVTVAEQQAFWEQYLRSIGLDTRG